MASVNGKDQKLQWNGNHDAQFYQQMKHIQLLVFLLTSLFFCQKINWVLVDSVDGQLPSLTYL
jgi:hypothetical protein